MNKVPTLQLNDWRQLLYFHASWTGEYYVPLLGWCGDGRRRIGDRYQPWRWGWSTRARGFDTAVQVVRFAFSRFRDFIGQGLWWVDRGSKFLGFVLVNRRSSLFWGDAAGGAVYINNYDYLTNACYPIYPLQAAVVLALRGPHLHCDCAWCQHITSASRLYVLNGHQAQLCKFAYMQILHLIK